MDFEDMILTSLSGQFFSRPQPLFVTQVEPSWVMN